MLGREGGGLVLSPPGWGGWDPPAPLVWRATFLSDWHKLRDRGLPQNLTLNISREMKLG